MVFAAPAIPLASVGAGIALATMFARDEPMIDLSKLPLPEIFLKTALIECGQPGGFRPAESQHKEEAMDMPTCGQFMRMVSRSAS